LLRQRDQAQLVVDEIAQLPDALLALALEVDVGDQAAVIDAAAEIDAAWGRVDGLINDAGYMPGSRPVLGLDLAVLDRVLRSNPISSFVATSTSRR
jgi:NAD(P)-dependent dehydrogenase (short-subunit alcohol dehydrogenase family)